MNMGNAPTAAQADSLGRAILRKRLELQPKERVTIEAYPSSLPWAAGFVREARRAGAYPMVHYEDEAAYWDAAEHGKAHLVGTLAAHERATLDETDVYVYFWGPEDVGRVERLPSKAQDSLVAFNPNWYKVAKKAGLRGARMGIARATGANAERFGLDLSNWRSEMLAASVRDPSSLLPTVGRLDRKLGGRGEVRLTHPNGTDLTLALVERSARKDTGVLPPRREWGDFGMLVNTPPGSVYVAVDESTAEGTIVANRSTTQGVMRVTGGRWTFHDGRLASKEFAEGGPAFERLYRAATGAKDRPSFLEVGTNPDLHGSPFLEENELGAVTVGIGGNVNFGGKSRSSLFTFLTVGGANLSIGGQDVVKAGRVL
jgi:leucyl aminopeptidase (aminopeptidase T)